MAKIVVVDDSIPMLNLLVALLEGEGHSVWPCAKADGIEDRISQFSPDLILLDIMMPRSGYEVLRSLKHRETTKDIPVILVSARSEASDVKWGLQQGAVDYIIKPFLNKNLIEKVNAQLPTKSTTS